MQFLTSFNGSEITCDALGNPLTYYDGTSFTWQGRRLVGAVKGTNTMSFTYDDNGLRTSKTVNGITTEYYWNGNLLVAEKTQYYTIVYNYDASGRPIGMAYHGSDYTRYQWDVYWFDLNVFGDVVAVYDNSGTQLLTYTYDPWGYCEVGYVNGGEFTQAKRNRISYRGYYYDTDLGLYYLQSRYYDANTYRFVNADGYISTGQGILGYNMFAYCGNNPVNYVDSSGEFAISTFIIGTLIGAAVAFGASVISQSLTGDKEINWGQVALDTVIGGISGALGASGVGQFVSIAAGGVLGAAGSIGGDLIASDGNWSQVNASKALLMGGVGALLGGWSGAGTQNTKAMVEAINSGKTWGSKAFLTSASEATIRPNSGLTLQTMYMNMSRAIGKYTIEGIAKVSFATLSSTIFGNVIGW